MKNQKSNYPTAIVREIDGQLVLEDPVAFAMIMAINKNNCIKTFNNHIDRIEYFRKRAEEKDLKSDEVVIVVINVDDPNGGPIADVLMPGFNWQEIRDRGEIPFARGLAGRLAIQEILEQFDNESAEKLGQATGLVAVIVDNNVAEIFPLEDQFVVFKTKYGKLGTPEYVYNHGIKRMKKGKSPSAFLMLGDQKVANPKAALHLAKLMITDTEDTLLGKPFLRSQIDWAEKYVEHLKGPHADIPFGPQSGIDECTCAICFYRDAPLPHNPQRECQMVGRSPQKFFGFTGPAKDVFMPPIINGKDLGHFCPKWLSPFAD